MLEIITEELAKLEGIAEWKIIEKEIAGSELFFIGRSLDMNRRKKVKLYKVTVYRDFVEEGEEYRGSSTTQVHPSMDRRELRDVLEAAAFAARYAKNKYYPLVEPGEYKVRELKSKFAEGKRADWLRKLSKAIYEADTFTKGQINSAELFLNQMKVRIINSRGVDVSYDHYQGELEFITNWQEAGEEVELYRKIDFSDYQAEFIKAEVAKMLKQSQEKALAKPTPALQDVAILLSGEPVKEFLKYYYYQSSARFVYEGISQAKLNENIQGENVRGDLINITLDPKLENSTASVPFDQDGFFLKRVELFKDGVLKRYWGNRQYSYYLDVATTGEIGNIVVAGGSKSSEELKAQPYLELLAFSDFQMDPLTGDFGGEIRLGRYFNGEEIIPVTGGSISGNIHDTQQEMYFSQELQTDNNFVGPQTVLLKNVNLSAS